MSTGAHRGARVRHGAVSGGLWTRRGGLRGCPGPGPPAPCAVPARRGVGSRPPRAAQGLRGSGERRVRLGLRRGPAPELARFSLDYAHDHGVTPPGLRRGSLMSAPVSRAGGDLSGARSRPPPKVAPSSRLDPALYGRGASASFRPETWTESFLCLGFLSLSALKFYVVKSSTLGNNSGKVGNIYNRTRSIYRKGFP